MMHMLEDKQIFFTKKVQNIPVKLFNSQIFLKKRKKKIKRKEKTYRIA